MMNVERGQRGRHSGDVTVVILGGGRGTRLDPLTRLRAKPAVPLMSKYRLIDVPISNAINSGMYRMFVLTQFNSVSLHRHITATYRFSTFSTGFVEVLAAQQTPGDETWFQGTADAVRQNLDFIYELKSRWVLILSGDHVYRLDYSLMLRDHMEHGAAVTLAVLPCSEAEIAGFGAVRVDETGRIVEFREKPKTPEERAGMEVPDELLAARGGDPERPYLASMGIYLFDREAMRDCLENREHVDFGKDVIPAAVQNRPVQAHLFHGYWRDIGTIHAFYDAHMDFVRPKPPFSFLDPSWVIYTHPRFLPGTRMDRVTIDRSVIADGALITGTKLKDSIVGVRSVIRDAELERTLLMGVDAEYPDAGPGAPPVGIGPGTRIENAIVDKNARIGRNVQLVNESGRLEREGEGWVIRDGIVVVPKNAVVPDGTVI